jgi:hypothetical protein
VPEPAVAPTVDATVDPGTTIDTDSTEDRDAGTAWWLLFGAVGILAVGLWLAGRRGPRQSLAEPREVEPKREDVTV